MIPIIKLPKPKTIKGPKDKPSKKALVNVNKIIKNK